MLYIHPMSSEVHGPDAFYATATGQMVRRLLRTRLRALWPELAGREVLGIGHAGPYLRLWRRRAARLVAALPRAGTGPAGILPWPADGPCAATLVEGERLPFADLSFDNVLMVHGLEHADHARRLLREVWRVLRDDGQLLVVVPNRRSIWAHLERTPLGFGQPYTPGQLAHLLEAALFEVERRDGALFIPPFRARALLRGARIWERAGQALVPNLAGLAIIEARKAVLGAIPAQPAAVEARRRVLLPHPARLPAARGARAAARDGVGTFEGEDRDSLA
ncbi:class I SAM-dependent methyltransferase [Roseomonas sp. OT10]|uniref:class I SAM-dependent methyltransferase n=1 Tax=Roseomonas cutis TaxID=2897332 RepID=UPI001E2E110B|nr:class I SAM-dependent methyltransferase [Roseomonas sp. OT10]UFN48714.1 class I SAM-dependent methyltransferase [Roseomonas sp. OT10]